MWRLLRIDFSYREIAEPIEACAASARTLFIPQPQKAFCR